MHIRDMCEPWNPCNFCRIFHNTHTNTPNSGNSIAISSCRLVELREREKQSNRAHVALTVGWMYVCMCYCGANTNGKHVLGLEFNLREKQAFAWTTQRYMLLSCMLSASASRLAVSLSIPTVVRRWMCTLWATNNEQSNSSAFSIQL